VLFSLPPRGEQALAVLRKFRVADAPAFALGLQWHPEWQFAKNPFSSALFAAFGEAGRQRATGPR